MGVNSLSKTVTRQRRDCDLNPGPSAPESSTATEPPIHRSYYFPKSFGRLLHQFDRLYYSAQLLK